MKERLDEVAKIVAKLPPKEGLVWLNKEFGDSARFSTALGMEDQIITNWIGREKLKISLFTLDTGRLFQESYDLLDLTAKKYNLTIQVFFPDFQKVESFVQHKGINCFYDSVENRKECCHIRKVEPLRRALKDATVWITGIRAEQSANRQSMEMIEWDDHYKLIKYNPLLNWSLREVQDEIHLNNIPVNALHANGFASIGCAPCTRALLPGEDIRTGRWWWESSAKECGLHEAEQTQNNLATK